MAHFFTGLYYFTWFQILIIIVTGGVVGQSLVSIYDLIQAIRHDRPIKPKIYMLLPWLITSVILLLSPVYSSNLGSAWMLIFAGIEILSAVLTRKIFKHRQQDQVDNGEQLNTEPMPSYNDFTNDYYYDGDHYEYSPGVSQSTVSEEPQQLQEPASSQPVKSQAPSSSQPIELQASAVQTPVSTSSQQASAASQAQPAVSSAAPAASQSASQADESEEDEMDKLFEYNENTDAELAKEARERQEKAQSNQAKIAKRLSEMEADHDKAN